MAAKITLNPASAVAGAAVTVTGTGFGWRWWATVTLSGAEVAKVQCSTSGAFTATFVVPPGSGAKVVKAKTYWRSAQATLTVTGVPVPPDPPPPPPPPPTSKVALDTRTMGWGLWKPIYHPDDAGFGADSHFGRGQQTSVGPNNVLTIRADRTPGLPLGRTYASACLGTIDTFAQKYGRWLFRMKLPKGQGSFPAGWLLGAGRNETPPEVDVVEYLPGKGGNGPNMVTATNWYGPPLAAQFPILVDRGFDWSLAFHDYELVWTPDALTFRVDGIETGRLTGKVPTGAMYPIVNLAMGTGQGYRTDASTPASLAMVIERVLVEKP